MCSGSSAGIMARNERNCCVRRRCPGEGGEEGAGDFDGLRWRWWLGAIRWLLLLHLLVSVGRRCCAAVGGWWWWLLVRVHHSGRLGHGEDALLDEGAEVGGEGVHCEGWI